MNRIRSSVRSIRILIFLFLITPAAVRTGQCQSFSASEDSYIHDANANTNYGTLTELLVKKGTSTNFRKAYVKFDLNSSGISEIVTAAVRLYATSSVAVVMNVYQVADTWSQTGITWNNAPAMGTLITSASLFASPGYYEWDIASYVQSQFASGDKVISLVFYSAAVTSPSVIFSSQEAASNQPQLVINGNVTPPAAPSNLIAASVSYSQINLSWTDNSTDESGFRIESKTGSGSYTEVATVAANVTSWSNTGLPAGTTMTYRVYAYNVAGSSGYSNEATATTMIPSTIQYYVDASGGNDANNGLSPATAWKTLTKVNATTFSAGNQILFKAGEAWTGRLYPKGSGISGSPVLIDMYGSGSKPLINGNGMTGTGVVYLYNQQYWEISNLEIMNNAATGGDRRGVRIEAENFGTANHIYLKNLYIHNIKGMIGQDRPEKRTGGIGFAIVDAASQETHFNDILVENCVITACENQGIITECVAGDGFDPYTPEWNAIKITNAVIRNNTISAISKNAMIIRLFEGGVVENNLCYNTANGISGNTIFSAACTGTVFQYNEGYGNHSPDADGSLYDADLRSPNTVWQYSYSHDNAHGLFWTCTVQADVNVICRYNISQNDKGIIFCINYPVTSVSVYNNTVYIPSSLSPVIISERNNGGSGSRSYTFNNNLIYNMSSTASYDWTSGYTRSIDYNCFYGIHPATEPADPHKVTTDPKLTAPGTGGTGISTVDGYKLLPGSSCINTGKTITGNGGKDYWGNILYNGAADIGAHEFYAVPVAPNSLQASDIQQTQLTLTWADNSTNETGFRIERRINSGSFLQISTTGPNVTTFTDAGISGEMACSYRVCAFNGAGNSSYSNTVMATNRWSGTVSEAWATAGNWLAGATPETYTYVTIPPAPYNPVISTAVSVGNIRVKSGAMLITENTGILQVLNDIIMEGTAP